MKLGLFVMGGVAASERCCQACPENQVKTYSVDHIFNQCGESCIDNKDFWKYKVFEPGLHRANATDQAVCAELGYADYKDTDVHGIPEVITIAVDMFKPKEKKLIPLESLSESQR